MHQELKSYLLRSVGRKLEYFTPATIDEYLRFSANDNVWVQGLFANPLHRNLTPPYTTIHHRAPPYATIHHNTPPYTTIHHHSHYLIGYHWLHAVSAIYNVCVVVVIHAHHSTYLFGDSSAQRVHLYKKEVETHYDALVPKEEIKLGIVPESPRKCVWWCLVVYGGVWWCMVV